MLAKVFTTILALTMVGTIYGTALLILKPFIHSKVTLNNMYKLYKWGLLFFCIPFGSILCTLEKWISSQFIPFLFEKNSTVWLSPTIIENKALGLSYPILNMKDENKFLIGLLPIFWIIGVIVCITIPLISQGVYVKRLKRTSFPINSGKYYEIYKVCREELGMSGSIGIYLWSNDKIHIPFGLGVVKYNIWLPEKEFSDQELRLIFLHEMTHILHRDMPMKYMLLLVNAIHWYNPFIYFYNKAMNLQCELACDEEVMKHLIGEEIISYGMLLMNIPKRKNINYVSLCSNFSHIKLRLYKIANPVAVKKSNLLCTVVIGAIISSFMFSVSVMSQQLVSPWKEKFIQKDGNTIAYENYLETENQIYQPYGLAYHKAASAFYYKGKRVKVFLDERHLTEQEKITCPWMEKAWQYIHVDANSESKLYLKTIRDENNEISHITFLDSEEAEEIINKNTKVVTFQSMYIGQNGFYASDRFEQGLPKEVIALGKNVTEHAGGLLKNSNRKEVSGYIYYNGGQYPWEIELEDGIMKVMLYTLAGGDKEKPTVIQYASVEEVREVVLYLDGNRVSLKDFT